MGNILSTTIGYGFTLPYFGDDGDEDEAPKRVRELMDELDDSYEVLGLILKDYPGFSFESPYLHDYSGEPVVYLKNTVATLFGIGPHVVSFDHVFTHAQAEVRALSEELGGSDPDWFLVTSYG